MKHSCFSIGVALSVTLALASAQAAVGLKVVDVQWDARTPMHTSAKVGSLGADALGIALGNHGAWGQVMDDKTGLCSELRTRFAIANSLSKGVSAYPDNTWYCRIGEMKNLQIAPGTKGEAVLTFDVTDSHLEAKFTQPNVGKWADPRGAFDWDMTVTVRVGIGKRMVQGKPGQFGPPTLIVRNAEVQLKNVRADSMNVVADFLMWFKDALIAFMQSKPLTVTNSVDAQIAGLANTLVPAGKELAGLWVQNGYALVALNPQPLPPGAYENCCDGRVSGRVHWPKSLGAPVSCAAINLERAVFVAPPPLAQPEPPLFSGSPRAGKPTSSVVFATQAPVDAGSEYHCDYSFAAGSRMAVDMGGGRFAIAGKGQQITIVDLALEAPQSLVLAGATNVNLVGQGMTASLRPPPGTEPPRHYDPRSNARREVGVAGALPSTAPGSRQAPALPLPGAGNTPNWGGAAAPQSALGGSTVALGATAWGAPAMGGGPQPQAPRSAPVATTPPGQAVAVQKVAPGREAAVQAMAPAAMAATTVAPPLSARSSGDLPPVAVAAVAPGATGRAATLMSACVTDPRPRVATIEGQSGHASVRWGQRVRISGCGFGTAGQVGLTVGAPAPGSNCGGDPAAQYFAYCTFAPMIVESWSDDAIVARLPEATGGEMYRATVDKLAVRVLPAHAKASLLSAFDNRIVGVGQ